MGMNIPQKQLDCQAPVSLLVLADQGGSGR